MTDQSQFLQDGLTKVPPEVSGISDQDRRSSREEGPAKEEKDNLKVALSAAGMVAIPGYVPENDYRDPALCRFLGIEDEKSHITKIAPKRTPGFFDGETSGPQSPTMSCV